MHYGRESWDWFHSTFCVKIILEKNKGIIYKHIGAKLAEMVKVPIIVTGGARNVD